MKIFKIRRRAIMIVNKTKLDISIINKYIDEYRREHQQLLNMAVSNKTLIETRDGLKVILQVIKGDRNENK